jgi:two-component system response regulator PilR (NtrC family)
MRLPDGDGLDLVKLIQQQFSALPVAVITAHGNVELAVRALKLGAFDFLSKPLDLNVLRKIVANALRLSSTDPSNTGLQPALAVSLTGPQLIGESPPMRALRELIARVARSQAPVFISGESGTGKELVARLIHDSGARRSGAFVPVNCGAIPAELMESELFGHKRGSFTGAIADKKGLVQSAEGGTLFLDEVADLPLHMQVKLLRLIQEKTVRPVGEAQEVPVDVRILSATHKPLAELVAQGKFREDLYYRINVIELRVPPLRDRITDLPALIGATLQRLGRKLDMRAPELSNAALELLRGYAFPGNVRELENILERAATLSANGHIDAADIELRRAPGASASQDAPAPNVTVGLASNPATGLGAANNAGNDLPQQLEDVERAAIVKALEQTRYNKTAAAKLLGMSFRALRYRTKKLGID